jgi:mRNA-degrading endonuclease RelE of RelBE toxin-antitoxin system
MDDDSTWEGSGPEPGDTGPEPGDTPRLAIRLAPEASAQVETLPENLRKVVRARLEELTLRVRTPVAPTVRGRILAVDFDALYEVDNQRGTVTVLNISTRP